MDENEILIIVGRNICAERNRAGLSQEGLAAIANINEKHLSKIENAHANPKITTIIAIADALNISREDIYKK